MSERPNDTPGEPIDEPAAGSRTDDEIIDLEGGGASGLEAMDEGIDDAAGEAADAADAGDAESGAASGAGAESSTSA
ncbi:MAG TPA: hypothetical protein VLS28_07690, partial [Candidatus Sulfomarinibacteraceae bacterium]|nr:hypothetical protein [Candidatus Sulfomarinibacteraceae bacterium]